MPSKDTIDALIQRLQKTAEKSVEKRAAVQPVKLREDGEDYTPVGVAGILASSEKLLAVNRGIIPPDERDSLAFKKTFRTHDMLRERVALDADKLRRSLLYRSAKSRTLKYLPVNYFDPYMEKQLIGNQLSSPLEEINPLQLVEQARRSTLMGPGGLSSSQSITADAQNIHPSSFGFLSTLEGPESEKIGVDARMSWGTKIGSDGRLYQQFKNTRTGATEWKSPESLEGSVIRLPK